jgi:hypothetical protein
MPRVGSGTGQGGKSLQDRALAAKVRTKGLQELYLILNDSPKVKKWSPAKLQTIQRLAPSLLPRLNEHTGEGGGALKITFDNAFTPSAKGNRQ